MSSAVSNSPMVDTVPASGDLSANQFLFHEIDTSSTLTLATVRGQRVHGVLQNDPAAAGRAASLCYGGLCGVIAGGTYQGGVPLTTDSAGKAIEATLWTDSVIGTAKEAGVANARSSMYVGVAGGYISSPEKTIVEDFGEYGTTDQVSAIQFDGTAADGTAEALNILHAKDNVFAYAAMGTQTITAPVIVAAGLDVGMDQTANDGMEMWSHMRPADGRPFIVGNDPAFYFLVEFSLEDVSGTDDFHLGFRRSEIMNATFDNYLDLASLGCEAADGTVDIVTILNNGASGVTDTGDTILDGVTYQFKILVSAAGVVTYQHDIAVQGTLAAPTTIAAFTFDDGDPVVPFFHYLQAAHLTGVFAIHNWDANYQ